jgi:hypothetical protein
MQPTQIQPPPPGAGGGDQGAGRLVKTAVIGGVIGGVLSSIPFLKALNCCFCLLNMGGAVIGLSMYLKEHPNEKLSTGDAAVSGAISGGVAGVIAGVVGFVLSLVMGAAMAGAYRNMPANIRGPLIAFATGGGVASIFLAPIFYAAFGALGGFLSMQLFFKERLKS